MEVTRISDHGYMLTHNNNYNAFLVRQELSSTLIDTTMPDAAEDIVAALQHLSFEGVLGISEIAITHAHLDHVGALDELVDRLPDPPEILSSAREARLLRRPIDTSIDVDEPQAPVKGSFTGVIYAPTRLMTDAQRIGALRCIFTPGHISFLDGETGLGTRETPSSRTMASPASAASDLRTFPDLPAEPGTRN